MAAPIGLSPIASRSSFWTSSATVEPTRSSLDGLNAGSLNCARVGGTNTWSDVRWAVDAWCLACVMRQEWYGTPRLCEEILGKATGAQDAETGDSRRVQHPADGIVDRLGLGEGLVATFVSDDPKASGHQTSGEAVQGPKCEPCEGIERRMGQPDG
jgi:hypothetical protein